jgi:hypothetical protein
MPKKKTRLERLEEQAKALEARLEAKNKERELVAKVNKLKAELGARHAIQKRADRRRRGTG